jgi:hypothetical protein
VVVAATPPFDPDPVSCFTMPGQEAFMDSSAVKLAELSALYSPTAEEIQISTLVWAAMIEAAETGQMRPSLGEAGVLRRDVRDCREVSRYR